MSEITADAARFGLLLALSEFIGPERLHTRDEDALAIRFVWEGLPVNDAIDLATLYAYFAQYPIPPIETDWQTWIDHPPVRVIEEWEREAIVKAREWAKSPHPTFRQDGSRI